MPIEIVPCSTTEELYPALTPVFHYFGATPQPRDTDRFIPFVEPSRAFMAREGAEVVGGCASFPFEQTVPGGVVRCAGLTVVGVMPTHRRRGILRQMMRAHLDDTRRRGEPVAALWASEDTIYGQFGYGISSFCGDMDIAKSATAYVAPFTARGAFRRVGEDEAVNAFPPIYERVRPHHPGMVSRSAEWWRNRRLSDPEHRRQGAGELNRILLTLDGHPSGYAFYRIHQKMEKGASVGHVQVIEAIGDSVDATREIWRLLLDIDWVARVKAYNLPVDHPLFFMLARPREMHYQLHDGLWTRLVDLPAAIAARKLGDADPVVFEVSDAFCEWNTGRWEIGPGGAKRAKGDAGIACDVTALGSAYLGGFSFSRLQRAGRVTELREGAIARADALFAWDRAPWCPEIF